MSQFTIQLKGLKETLSSLESIADTKKLNSAIGFAALSFHSSLRSIIKNDYATPGTLDNVLQGKSTSIVRTGKNFVETGLIYINKPIPLIKYPHNETAIPIDGRFPTRLLADGKFSWKKIDVEMQDKGYVKWLEKRHAMVVQVAIQRGIYKGKFLSKQPAFIAKRNSDNLLKRSGIFARTTQKTWDVEPWLDKAGKRAKYKELYGPSYVQLVETVITSPKYSPRVEHLYDKMATDILDAIIENQ